MPTASAILRKKDFPLNYPEDVVKVIDAMSFKKGGPAIVGSMSLKSQQYAGDYDMFEVVSVKYSSDAKALQHLVQRFQQIVRSLSQMRNVFVGDIKAGEIPEWNVLDAPPSEIPNKVAALVSAGVVSSEEGGEVQKILKDTPSPQELQKVLKFHVVRWTPADVARGSCELRDGRTYTLEEAFASPAIVKLDVVALVQNNRYTDFSIIYQFKNGSHILNKFSASTEVEDLRADVAYYMKQHNYFKAMKRMFSLAKYYQDDTMIERLNGLFNGDLGRIYSVLSDIGTLQYLLENEESLPLDRIRYEIDQFRGRLGNVFTLSAPNKVLAKTVGKDKSRSQIERTLQTMGESLEDILSKAALKAGKAAKVLPPPPRFT